MDWKHFFDRLGMNGTWWQWRILKLQQRWQAFRTDTGLRAEQAGYEHRLCRACGALTDRDERVCPRCGASLEHWRKAQVRRALGLIVPVGLTVSYLLMAANVLVMAIFLLRFGGLKLLLPDSQALAEAGALMPDMVDLGQWWRILTYAFLHGGLLHIAFNMMSLSQVGPVTEEEIGRSRFWVLYILAALGGAAADILWHQLYHSRPLVVGASGAIFGLIGFGLTFNYAHGGHGGRRNAGVYLQWALYSFAFGHAVPGVDNVCHAGGFITGALLGFVIQFDLKRGGPLEGLWRTLAGVLLIALLASFGFAIANNLR